MKKPWLLFCLLWLVPFLGSEVFSSDDTAPIKGPKSCQKAFNANLHSILNAIVRMEKSYTAMNWHYQKMWFISYQPLWEAKQQRLDPMSAERQTQGEVMERRYLHLVETYQNLAAAAERDIQKNLTELRDLALRQAQLCPAWDYQRCYQYWLQNTQSHLDDVENLIRRIRAENLELSALIHRTMDESPSDHAAAYGERLRDRMEIWNVQFNPRFLSEMQNLEEDFTYHMIEKKCVPLCTAENIKKYSAADPNPLLENPRREFGQHEDVFPRQSSIGVSLKALEETVQLRKAEER